MAKYPIFIIILVLIITGTAGCITINSPQPGSTMPSTTIPSASAPAESPPSIITFAANPSELLAGESSTLTWNIQGATNVEITPDVGTVSNSGSIPVTPQGRTVYTITASNSGGSNSETIVVEVNRNVNAKQISLSIEEMEDRQFIFLMNSQPSVKGTISTYYVNFALDNLGTLFVENTIYVYNTTAEAENVFADDKYNSRMYVTNFIAVGTQGYYMEHINNPDEEPTYALRFQKSNVYVKMISNLGLEQLESFAHIVADRIY